MRKQGFCCLLVALLLLVNNISGQNRLIDLSGEWRFALDSTDIGESNQWFNTELPSKIHLPGSTDQAGYGTPHKNGTNLYTGDPEIWQLARKNVYIGKAWYQKEITIPEDYQGKQVSVSFERCMWQTRLWVNGVYAGESHSLCAPHSFDISSLVRKGKNMLTLQIDNSPYVHLGTWSHGYSPGLQTIWNGAVGEIAVKVADPVYIENIQCYPSLKNKQLRVKTSIVNKGRKQTKGKLQIKISDKQGNEVLAIKKSVNAVSGETDFNETFVFEKDIQPWDEFTPTLYTLEIQSSFGNNHHSEQMKFGFRDVSIENGRLLINGYKTFLRGEHDGGSFPLTGYPSMNKEDWLRILKAGKDYGFNHWRFHSWCPPEAAFEAADELGVYLQPELTLFSQDWEHTLIGQDTARDEFLFSELKRLINTFGNHPSFLVMCMGNELRGEASILEKWVAWGKANDNRHLYVSSANLEAMRKYLPLSGDDLQVAHAVKVDGKRYERRMGSYFNTEKPGTDRDYSETLFPPYDQFPGVIHETGQWTVYPDFREIGKYTGVLSPRNLEVFRSRLEQKGMLEQAGDFLHSSGKLSAILYREEMERVLRTPGIGGVQLLDLRDYPAQGSALVGLLNVFWESKGIITPEEFRQSCNPLTLLLKMSKRVWLNNETFKAGIVVPNYLSEDLHERVIEWSVRNRGAEIVLGEIPVALIKQGDVNFCGSIEFPLTGLTEASRLEIHLSIPSLNITNQYNVWVYPVGQAKDLAKNIRIVRQATPELLEQIKQGADVLLVPDKLADGERTTFTTPFWSTILFDYQPKTMGILCDPKHPLFKDFPTDAWSDWQWWELTANAFSARLNQTKHSYRPILQVIDHPVRNDKLGAIVETSIGKGRLLVCTFDILSDPEERPVARQLLRSILQYMNSADFTPENIPELADIFFAKEATVQYRKIEVSNDNSDHPVMFAFDNDDKTYWQMPLSTTNPVKVKIELLEERYIVGCRLLSKELESGTSSFKVYISDKKEEPGEPVILGDGRFNVEHTAELWDNGFTVQKGKKGKFITVEFEPGDIGSSINEFGWIFGD